MQDDLKQNPSSFWSFIKSRKNSNSIPADVQYNGSTANSAEESANLFADFFQSVFSSATHSTSQNGSRNIDSFDLNLPPLIIAENDVHITLKGLDKTKGAGTDGLTPSMLFECADVLAAPVAKLFNRSLQEKTFPDVWKIASIAPVHKSGNIHQVSNYRGISILNCLGKVFETIVHKVLYNAAQPLISEFQHGFVKKRSTTTNLMCYTNHVINQLEKRRQVDTIYVDFSKAFDKVPHSLAIAKLSRMGFPDWTTEWLRSYLTNRKAFVKLNSTRSREFDITSGVPQGSILGPLIFVLYVNDLCARLKSGKLLYADDLKIFRVVSSLVDCCALQADISELECWSLENGMEVNFKKTKIISFTRRRTAIKYDYTMNSETLERVETIRDLGVIVDNKLRFNENIATTTAKAFAVLGFVRRNTASFDNIYALKAIYCSLVRSILEYAVPVWAPYHLAQAVRIERVQRCFVRYALRQLPWNDPLHLPDYTNRCKLIDLETLATRRKKIQRLFVFDLLMNNIDCSVLLEQLRLNAPHRQLRNHLFLTVPVHRTSYGYNNPISVCMRNFNEVQSVFDFNISKNCFKLRIKNIN